MGRLARWRQRLRPVILIGIIVLLAIQLVPYGREHENPPVTQSAPWPGRDELNLSRWDDDAGEADDAIEAVLDGTMPPRRYVLMHPRARLTEEEVGILLDALQAMDD